MSGFNDRRSLLFGLVMLLSATSYARVGESYFTDSLDSYPLLLFGAIPLDCLLPFYFWHFSRVFPEAFLPHRTTEILGWCTRVALVLGLVLLSFNLLGFLFPSQFFSRFENSDPTGLYPILVYGATLPVFLVIWLRMRNARSDERRRVRVFGLGLLMTVVPMVGLILLTSLSDDIADFILSDEVVIYVIPPFHILALATPLITAYAVLVEQALPVNVVLRQTLRHSLGTVFLNALIAAPLILLAFFLYTSRNLTMGEILAGSNGVVLGVCTLISIALFQQRRSARDYLDNLFYRGEYEPSSLLAQLSTDTGHAENLEEVAQATRSCLHASLHPESIHLLFLVGGDALRDPQQELGDFPLSPASLLTLKSMAGPIDIGSSPFITDAEFGKWLGQVGASFVVPIHLRGKLQGILTLGPKRSELPYTQDNVNFMTLVVNTITVACANLMDHWDDEAMVHSAAECTECGRVEQHAGRCSRCGCESFRDSTLPYLLHNQYKLVRVLGGGGMGTVYLAEDEQLGRPVVLKSVISKVADELAFLRREARVMARLNHPGVATIFGVESYHGTPILVCEYLENGTLLDVLSQSLLDREDIILLVDQLAQALSYIHKQGIVHGDIKPSNIGFDAEENAKLLDFGLAGGLESGAANQVSGGTYAYMSPERFAGAPPDPRTDLWALGVTLFECLYGENPFEASNLEGTAERLADPVNALGSVTKEFDAFFEAALHPDISRRPQSAIQFMRRLLG